MRDKPCRRASSDSEPDHLPHRQLRVGRSRRGHAPARERVDGVGAVASTRHCRAAGVASTFPSSSAARASRRCRPSASVAYVGRGPQSERAAPSRLHEYRSAGVRLSSPESTKLAERDVVAALSAIPSANDVSGGMLSGETTRFYPLVVPWLGIPIGTGVWA